MQALRADESRTIEMWGGLECTINRVRDQWFDQFSFGPIGSSVEAIDLAAGLGIKALRFPLLWERIAPGNLSEIEWAWSDTRIERLRELNVAPIVGLVHHGSGPRHTSLLDSLFPEKLALYARAVAERYPHLRYVTPINEPLTTARFSTLYGHWYPHHRSRNSFALALLTQCIATRDTMRAMRDVIPDLQLIQTEDLGRISSTPELEHQARFENERRWLTFDLLSGLVDRHHPLWTHLAASKVAVSMLDSLADEPSPPDIIGVNYYVTSDRHLDHRTDQYPGVPVGGNGVDSYVDVEAVRVPGEGASGHCAILTETWRRYHLPLALTEVHLACSREQQVQWLLAAWDGAHKAKSNGCDVRAITSWALMGSFGWDKLLTSLPFSYESGAFIAGPGHVRRTAVGAVISDLATNGATTNPAASANPWWTLRGRQSLRHTIQSREALVVGGTGSLGTAFRHACEARGIRYRAPGRLELDITDASAVRDAIATLCPLFVVNAAGYVRVDDAERDETGCIITNVTGATILARECARQRVPFVTFSSDLVFDGRKRTPYVESDSTAPLNVYGLSKQRSEREVLESNPAALVIRSSAFFGPWDEKNFATLALRRMTEKSPVMLPSPGTVSPTYLPDLANASLDLLLDGEAGVWHLANSGALSWSEFATELASRAWERDDFPPPSLEISGENRAAHPLYSALASERGAVMPTLDNALDRYFTEVSDRLFATIST